MHYVSSTQARTGRSVIVICLVIVMTTALAGCVSKSRLEECQQDKVKLEEQVASWETRFDQESQRWNSMQASISEAVPQAINEFHAERDRILEIVPEQVKVEVETYLDGYFNTVMRGMRELNEANKSIKGELDVANRKLESLGQDTSEIKTMGTALDEKLDEQRAERAKFASQVTNIFNQLTEFDNTIINCRDCPERLRLNRKERETITAFHQKMLTELSALQSQMQ